MTKRKAVPVQQGYTAQESVRIARFVADFKADTRTWQERVIANAPHAEREKIARHLVEMSNA